MGSARWAVVLVGHQAKGRGLLLSRHIRDLRMKCAAVVVVVGVVVVVVVVAVGWCGGADGGAVTATVKIIAEALFMLCCGGCQQGLWLWL